MTDRLQTKLLLPIIGATALIAFIWGSIRVEAVTNPQSGSIALQGTIPTDPPKQGATISFPRNGQTITSLPVEVTGVCPNGLLVKLFKNGIFAGSDQCQNGSFAIKIDLFDGKNELIARVFDSLDQEGPVSNKITVTYAPSSPTATVDRIILTSNYAKRGADPGQTLRWPVTVSGGAPPYAISIDWGDGNTQLISRKYAGEFVLEHVYEASGTYRISIQATDSNGVVAFLQVIGVANGPLTTDNAGGAGTSGDDTGAGATRTATKIITWPLYVMFFFIVSTFWLGRRYELNRLRRRIERRQPI